MRHVAAVAFQGLHRFQRRLPISRHAQIIGVDVDRVRQSQPVDRVGHFADDLTRRHVKMVDHRIDSGNVARLMMFPHLDAARAFYLPSVGKTLSYVIFRVW